MWINHVTTMVLMQETTAVKNHKQLALRSLFRLKCDYHCQLLLVSVTDMECRIDVLRLSLVQFSRMWGLSMNTTHLWWLTKIKFVENGLKLEGSFQASSTVHCMDCTLMVGKIVH